MASTEEYKATEGFTLVTFSGPLTGGPSERHSNNIPKGQRMKINCQSGSLGDCYAFFIDGERLEGRYMIHEYITINNIFPLKKI